MSLFGNSYPYLNTDKAKCFETIEFFNKYDDPNRKTMIVIDR